MKIRSALLVTIGALWASVAGAWDARVTGIMHHLGYVAVYLSPDPGVGSCSYGSPYILVLDDSDASKQRFAMVMQASATGQQVSGFNDGCSDGIWGQSRPKIERLVLHGN